ncbi:MAG: polysaccharide biosynthesis tyrosine autokinase [Oscillospiraceae bacterium]|nr:polysaccharide biosynthesis tyrosine autokinase [Oscillospiraceae bacterium]
MEEKAIRNNEEIEIDLKRLLDALLDKAWLIAITALLCAVIAFAGTFFFITPQYKSSAMFYVNNSDISVGGATLSLDASDISASRGLVDTYIVILKTRETMLDVIDYAGLDLSYEAVNGMVSAAAVDETEVFRVTVTHSDPATAEQIANSIAYILPKRISTIIEGSSAKVVDEAVVPTSPSSPSYTRNTMMGFLIGCVLAAGLVVLRELLDITIRTEEDIARGCKHPVLAAVPDMEVNTKGGYYYGYGKQAKSHGKPGGRKKQVELVGGTISFAAAEAYKLLRTKLQFSFVDDGGCRVIGVSSALSGEGKTLSSVNLAYSTSQLGKRVLLIDCDMRRPTLAEKLPINKTPGLSDYLTGQAAADTLIQLCGIQDDECAFHAISSGRTPPNPMELLSSSKMKKMIAALRERYDYIILDFPPVGEVSDALAAAPLTDGMLMVVRQDLCDRIALNNTVRQFEFVDAKILGVVFNCATEDTGYNNKYYKRYYKKYGTRYAHAARKAVREGEK